MLSSGIELPPVFTGGAEGQGWLARAKRRVDDLLTGMLSDDADPQAPAAQDVGRGEDSEDADLAARSRPGESGRPDRAGRLGVGTLGAAANGHEPGELRGAGIPVVALADNDPGELRGAGIRVIALAGDDSGEAGGAGIPVVALAGDDPGELRGAGIRVIALAGDEPGEAGGAGTQVIALADPEPGEPARSAQPAFTPDPVSRPYVTDVAALMRGPAPEPEDGLDPLPAPDEHEDQPEGSNRRRPDDSFWGPAERPGASSAGGYRSKHRLEGRAKPRDGSRSKPRHAAPSATFGSALSRKLAGSRMASRADRRVTGTTPAEVEADELSRQLSSRPPGLPDRRPGRAALPAHASRTDNLSAQRGRPATVGSQAQPGQFPLSVLGVIGQNTPRDVPGRSARQVEHEVGVLGHHPYCAHRRR